MECCCYLRNIQDLLSDGTHHMKGGSECHLTDQFVRLEQWSNIILFLLGTCQDYINLVQKSCHVYSLDIRYTRGRIWKGDILVTDIEELEEPDASEGSMHRKC